MTQIGDVSAIIEQWAPLSTAEDWDNIGLMHGSKNDRVESIIIALDLTLPLLNRVKDLPNTLIITHHPPIFKPLKNLVENTNAVKTVCEAVRNSVALYTAHTNLDRAVGGVSYSLAKKLGLTHIQALSSGGGYVKFVTFAPAENIDTIRTAAASAGAGCIGEYSQCSFNSTGTGTYIPSEKASPYKGRSATLSREEETRLEMIVPAALTDYVVDAARSVHPYEEMAYDLIPLENDGGIVSYGAVGELPSAMEPSHFADHVAASLNIDSVNISKTSDEKISRVAVLGGSGGSFIPLAENSGADAYVSGEFSHHDYIDHGDKILLIDAGHRATELPVLETIAEKLASFRSLSSCSITIDTDNEIRFNHVYNPKNNNNISQGGVHAGKTA